MRFLKNFLSFNLMIVCAFLVFSNRAHALLIQPSDSNPPYIYTGNETSQDDINDILDGLIHTHDFLYKADVGIGESGSLSDSYKTTFSNSATNPSDATIEYTGGDIVGPEAYLLVKDGRQVPAWYLFALSGDPLNWNGTETIELEGFWPNQGAISHVALYGQPSPTPEPAAMLLLGTGLVGLAGFRKKFIKR